MYTWRLKSPVSFAAFCTVKEDIKWTGRGGVGCGAGGGLNGQEEFRGGGLSISTRDPNQIDSRSGDIMSQYGSGGIC